VGALHLQGAQPLGIGLLAEGGAITKSLLGIDLAQLMQRLATRGQDTNG